eukprot:TRINITY_DN689_c3_g1_i1.p1 TRINITY_DN689_c3_g1~~TRINITY_DN689_c3_g1_i1.p1  ORF type:complete len:371 (+),score=65.67 TRINITY_DN689_c3_g1_i1:78-1190(+)
MEKKQTCLDCVEKYCYFYNNNNNNQKDFSPCYGRPSFSSNPEISDPNEFVNNDRIEDYEINDLVTKPKYIYNIKDILADRLVDDLEGYNGKFSKRFQNSNDTITLKTIQSYILTNIDKFIEVILIMEFFSPLEVRKQCIKNGLIAFKRINNKYIAYIIKRNILPPLIEDQLIKKVSQNCYQWTLGKLAGDCVDDTFGNNQENQFYNECLNESSIYQLGNELEKESYHMEYKECSSMKSLKSTLKRCYLKVITSFINRQILSYFNKTDKICCKLVLGVNDDCLITGVKYNGTYKKSDDLISQYISSYSEKTSPSIVLYNVIHKTYDLSDNRLIVEISVPPIFKESKFCKINGYKKYYFRDGSTSRATMENF